MSAHGRQHGTEKGASKRAGLVVLFVSMFAAGFIVPSLAYAAPQTFAQLVGALIAIINPLAALLVACAVLFFFVNVIQYIASGGGESRSKYRENLTWSVIALFVLVSVWGLARLTSNIFLGAASGGQQTQTPEEMTRQRI